ncbi:MAG: aminopeptidase P family protein [Lachnospiraceae bacterium]|nr:aminopeptidase P family protein [Lachnospiraceae bacterium]
MNKNIIKVRELLAKRNLDAVMITDEANLRYFSGFTGGTGIILIFAEKQYLFTDSRYTTAATNQAPDYEIVDPKNAGYGKVINEYLCEEKAVKIGFEDQYTYVNRYNSFVKEFVGKELVALGNELDLMRSIKTVDELEKLEMAEHIGDLAFEGILNYIKPGLTELEIAAKLEYLLKTNGAEKLSFETIIASGENSALPHAEPSERVIKHGDLLTMDFGCVYKGYCSDMTRTIVVGKANDKQKEIYDTVLEAQLKVLDMCKAGLAGKEYDKVARDYIYSKGYEGYFGHGLGHSVGLKIHEDPRFSMLCNTIIEPNTIMTVEPGIYIPGFGGVRIEDMICVTENGYINYAHSEKKLIEL